MYRVGWFGWKTLCSMGVPLLLRVDVHFDKESKTFWADSPDVDGLAVAGNTIEEVRSEAMNAAFALVELQLEPALPSSMKNRPALRYREADASFA
jgi:predicted RNase H-like HicB family nuclease